jgi:hypothetical protein
MVCSFGAVAERAYLDTVTFLLEPICDHPQVRHGEHNLWCCVRCHTSHSLALASLDAEGSSFFFLLLAAGAVAFAFVFVGGDVVPSSGESYKRAR